MNPYIRSFLLASGLALGVAGTGALAQSPAGSGGSHHVDSGGYHQVGGGGHGPERLMRRLDLTDAQRDQVFKIFHEQAPAIREQMNAARNAGRELRQSAMSGNFDRARARQLADAQAKAMSEVSLMRADSMSRVVAILTPEQRQKLEQLRERGGSRRGRG